MSLSVHYLYSLSISGLQSVCMSFIINLSVAVSYSSTQQLSLFVLSSVSKFDSRSVNHLLVLNLGQH